MIIRGVHRCLLFPLMFVSTVTAAEEESSKLEPIVVTASRVAVPESQVGGSITVIRQEEIEQRQMSFVSDVLRDVPGVAVNRSGGVGQLTQVRIRGGEAAHTLILIDGIEANDPALGSQFDFAHLLTSDVERVEVLRGPQSSLWGADALAGVINIITRKGAGPLHLGGHAQGGSFATLEGGGELSGGSDRYHFAVRGTHYRTDGINVSETGSEKDGYTNGTVSFRGGLTPAKNFDIDVVARHTDATTQFDPTPPPLFRPADGDRKSDVSQNYGRIQTAANLFDGHWRHQISAAITDTDNDNFDDRIETSSTRGRKFKLDYQTTLTFDTPQLADATHTLTFVVEREREEFSQRGTPTFFGDPNQEQDMTNYGYVGEYLLGLWQQLFLSGAVRYDDNELFANATTYRATATYLLPRFRTKVHGSYGTGVKNPTFTERFGFTPDTFFGNPNLKPAQSEGWEIGIEQPFVNGRYLFVLTYFHENLEDEIDGFFFDPTLGPFGGFTAVNKDGTSKRQGVELTASAELGYGLSVRGAYTYTDATEPDSTTSRQVREIRRPIHLASLDVNYRFLNERANINLAVNYNGEQKDRDFSAFPAPLVTLKDFALVSLAVSYDASRNVQFFGRVENLLNQDYQEVLGFEEPGIGGFAGVKVGLDL